MEYPEIIKRDKDATLYQACIKCKSIQRSIETIHRSDGNALQLITCTDCDHKWKEIWEI